MSEISLTIAQFLALDRLYQSLSDRASIRRVVFEHPAAGFVRVTFDAGWGTGSYDIDLEGNSEQVTFGSSGISIDAEGVA